MNWSLPDYTAPPDAEEIFNQMCGRHGLVVALVGNSGSDEGNGMIVADRKGMVESSVVERTESDVDRSESDAARKESDVNPNGGVTSDVAHTIFQLGTLARRKFAQHYQPGRKSIFTPATLLEKSESDKGDETDILEDDKIQLLDSLHIQHGRLTNREIAFIIAIRAITGSMLVCTYICAPITGRTSYLLRRKIAKLLVDKPLPHEPTNT